MLLRAITPQDWDAILAIQDECYSQLDPEPLHVLQSKWQVSPVLFCVRSKWVSCQLLLSSPLDHQYAASALSTHHPFTWADTLYLHDIALSAKAQGLGAGAKALPA